MKTFKPSLFLAFFQAEQASGVVLLFSALTAMLLANSPAGQAFLDFWHLPLGSDWGGLHLRLSLGHWINDGLMAVFFLVVGLEIERELYSGELSERKNAILPLAAALGGSLLPALLHFGLNRGSPTQAGFGIPMATDIAFALGILSLLGKRVHLALKVFLTALAIIDDLVAILVIALFYTSGLNWPFLALALATWGFLFLLNRLGVRQLAVYLLGGLVLWYAVLESGIHASIAGVLLAFAIPFSKDEADSPSTRLEQALHKPVAFGIMPLFALANTGVSLAGMGLENLLNPNALGILLGLLLGKPLGISLAALTAVRLRLANWPAGVSSLQMLGVGFLGGIGFTMSIFVTLLAFGEGPAAQNAKLAIMLASLLSGLTGYLLLRRFASPRSA